MSFFHKHYYKLVTVQDVQVFDPKYRGKEDHPIRRETIVVQRCIGCGHLDQYTIDGNHAGALKKKYPEELGS